MPGVASSVRLFEFDGIVVFLHWSWFLVAVGEIATRRTSYASIFWNILEYLALFAIVLLHEFGHALACRSVGGRADRILLWPLGGVAIVKPPPRPGATFWSIAAGPAVNVMLIPLLATGLVATARTAGTGTDVYAFWRAIGFMNLGLLLFNLLPVYPLDGGQMFASLLWAIIGRPRGLMVTAVVGLIGVAALAWLGLRASSPWLVIIAVFAATRCITAFRFAQALKLVSDAPGRPDCSCPSCGTRPPAGGFWRCRACGISLDVFDHIGNSGSAVTCPGCHTTFDTIFCFVCGDSRPPAEWMSDDRSFVESPTGRVRFRAPQRPSIGPLVSGLCIAFVAATALLVAVTTVSALALLVTLALAAAAAMPVRRYHRSRREFEARSREHAAALAEG